MKCMQHLHMYALKECNVRAVWANALHCTIFSLYLYVICI